RSKNLLTFETMLVQTGKEYRAPNYLGEDRGDELVAYAMGCFVSMSQQRNREADYVLSGLFRQRHEEIKRRARRIERRYERKKRLRKKARRLKAAIRRRELAAAQAELVAARNERKRQHERRRQLVQRRQVGAAAA